jgi:hypothetical protein
MEGYSELRLFQASRPNILAAAPRPRNPTRSFLQMSNGRRHGGLLWRTWSGCQLRVLTTAIVHSFADSRRARPPSLCLVGSRWNRESNKGKGLLFVAGCDHIPRFNGSQRARLRVPTAGYAVSRGKGELMTFKIAALVLSGAFLCTALTATANSVKPTSRSNYGGDITTAGLNLVGQAGTPVNGFTPEIVCPDSDDCVDNPGDLILEIITPDVPSGSFLNIAGAGETTGVYCAGSFFGDCTVVDPSTQELITQLSAAQTACTNGINDTFTGGVDTISVPSCALATANGTQMALLFGNFTSIPPIQASVSTPEPGSFVLLGAGLLGLLAWKRSLA